ncbi:hypothetical protein [Vibrio jasicida]|uniref:hypothetical protein n=1 Tax=Vibrio jasicida TaxID=766224 RepID=UPI0015E2F3BD|nr:hypothetical protein [Vibrio jasicida]
MMNKEKLQQSKWTEQNGYGQTLDFDLAKLVEEVGELAVEVQVMQGRLPAS